MAVFFLGLALTLMIAAGSHAADSQPANNSQTTKGPMQLSLETSVLFALHKNPDLLIALEKEKQEDAGIDEARALYYPQVDVSTKTGREYNNPTASSNVFIKPDGEYSNSWDAHLLITQLLYDGGATDEDVEKHKSLLGSADLQTKIAVEKILSDTINAYVEVWRAQRAVEESHEYTSAVEEVSTKVNLLEAGGAESKIKRDYVASRLAAARSEVNLANAQLTSAVDDLEYLTGSLPPFVATRPEQLDPTVRSLQKYFDKANIDNTSILLNQSDQEALNHAKESQEGTYMPTLSLQEETDRSQDVGGKVGRYLGSSVMLVARYKLFDGFSRDAENDRIVSQIRENGYRRDKVVRDTNHAILAAYNQILAIKQDIATTFSEIVASQNLQKLYKKQTDLGEEDVINTVENLERLHAAKEKSFKLESDLVQNAYTLLRQVGALRKERFCVTC